MTDQREVNAMVERLRSAGSIELEYDGAPGVKTAYVMIRAADRDLICSVLPAPEDWE